MAVDVVTTSRVVRGLADTYRASFLDASSGDPVDPGDVTISMRTATGTDLVPAGTPMSGAGASPRDYPLTSSVTAQLDRLVVTIDSETYGSLDGLLEVVGRHLYTIPEMRAYNDNALADTVKFPDSIIEMTRDRVTDEFEQITGVSFIPRYDLVVTSGPVQDSNHLLLYKSSGDPALHIIRVRSADVRTSSSTTWVALTTDQLADVFVSDYSSLYREAYGPWVTGVENTRVGFEHGYEITPLAIKQAAMILTRYLLVPTNLNSRALQEVGEFGTVLLATAGRFGDHYGIPTVDSVLDRFTERVPVIR